MSEVVKNILNTIIIDLEKIKNTKVKKVLKSLKKGEKKIWKIL